MGTVKIVVQGVRHTFRDAVALAGVDWEIGQGELWALVGPNGAGKSTLLRRLSAGIRGPGFIFLDGKSLDAWPLAELARRLTMLEQEQPTDLGFRVEDLVALGRHPHLSRWSDLSPQDRAKVREALQRLKLDSLAHRRFSELSGGERRKVLLAMVLAQDTDVLLLDEPTAHLDVAYQLEIMALLRNLAEEGRAVVCAMHDLNLACSFAHKMALLCQGRILAQGIPEQVLQPENLRQAFGVEGVVERNPLTGTLHVFFAFPNSLIPAGTPNPLHNRAPPP